MSNDYREWLKGESDESLWGLYEKYREHDDLSDAPDENQLDINDRINYKDAIIEEMNARGLFDKEPGRA